MWSVCLCAASFVVYSEHIKNRPRAGALCNLLPEWGLLRQYSSANVSQRSREEEEEVRTRAAPQKHRPALYINSAAVGLFHTILKAEMCYSLQLGSIFGPVIISPVAASEWDRSKAWSILQIIRDWQMTHGFCWRLCSGVLYMLCYQNQKIPLNTSPALFQSFPWSFSTHKDECIRWRNQLEPEECVCGGGALRRFLLKSLMGNDCKRLFCVFVWDIRGHNWVGLNKANDQEPMTRAKRSVAGVYWVAVWKCY